MGENNIIENVYDGDLTYEEMQQVFKATYALGFQLQDKRLPVKIISDVSALGSVPLEAIKELAVLGIKSFPIQKLAMVGARKELEVAANLILGLAGKKNIFRLFPTRAEALKWLSASK